MEDFAAPEFRSPYQILLDHCESGEGLKFRAEPDLKGVFFMVQGQAAIYDIALLITHDDEVLQIYATIPVTTTDERLRPLVAEFAARANHGLVIGHFDFDMDGGKLRYHIGHAFGERGLDDASIGRLMATMLDTLDRYFPALMRTMYGGHTPADAIYVSELDYEFESDGKKAAEAPPSLRQSNTKPAVPKNAKRRRPNRRPQQTQDLPGLFDRVDDRERGEGSPPTA